MSQSFQHRYGPWALVAGASEGLGAAFAEAVAARGLNVLLVSRRRDALDRLASDLRAKHNVEARAAAIDLGSPDLLGAVREAARDLTIGLMVYNAAYSKIGPFLDHPLDDALRTVDVNAKGPLILAHEFGRGMAARGRGGVLLMSSLTASQGSALIAAYAATKAFNLVLAEGLWDELRERGVDVLACRAGATRTPAFEASKPRVEAGPMMEPAEVAEEALRALGKGPSMVPGWLNAAAATVMGRLLPKRTAIHIMGSATRKMYG